MRLSAMSKTAPSSMSREVSMSRVAFRRITFVLVALSMCRAKLDCGPTVSLALCVRL